MSTCRAHRYDLCVRRSLVCDTVDSSVTKQWVQQGASLEGLHLWKGRYVHQKVGLGPWDLNRHHKIDVIYQHLHVNCDFFQGEGWVGPYVSTWWMEGRNSFKWHAELLVVGNIYRWLYCVCFGECAEVCVVLCFVGFCESVCVFFVVWWYLKINQKF